MLSDLKFAIRSLKRSPASTMAIVAALALGIGANTAIFSVVNAVLLRPTPFANPDRLAVIWETDRDTGTTREPASWPDLQDFARRSHTLSSIGGFVAGEVNLSAASGEPRRIAVLQITHGLLPMLGLQPIAGRSFTAAEDTAGGARVALISDALWAREFNRDPAAVGRTLRLDDRQWTIVGIMPPESDFGILQILTSAAYARSFADRGERSSVDIWMTLQADEASLPRSTHPVIVLGALAPGATFGAAQSELSGIAADLERAYPNDNAARGAHVEPLTAVVFGPVRPALFLLLGAVALVLIVACVNAASLLLARSSTRAREVSVRRALGAGSGPLLRLFLAESMLLTAAAAALGVAIAFAGVRLMIALAPADVPRLDSASVDGVVLGATAAVSVLVAFVFGLTPALQLRRTNVEQALNAEGLRTSTGHGANRLQRALVISELALAVLLVCSAGLLIRSFWKLEAVDAGFSSHGVLKAEYQLPDSRYPSDFRQWPNFAAQHAFTRGLLARAATLPGVEAAAIAGNHPLDPGFTNSFTVVGREAEARTWPEISIRRVTPGYFRTVGLALVRGRLLQDGDTTDAPAVALINEAAARRFFGESDPLGHQIRFWGTARTIVGVVANERFHGLDKAPPIAAYTPLLQTPSATGVLLLRTSGDPESLAASARRAIRDIDPGLAVFGVEPLDLTVARSVSQRRFTMLLLGAFALLALTLAAIGVQAILSYRVAARRREIGIRMALGAAPTSVLGLVLRDGAVLTVAGLAIGLGAAAAFTRLLRSLLFGVTPVDPLTFAAVAVCLAVVAVAAALAPALRASHVDPLVVLRSE
jgi:putative ABC transport system permease protein